MLAAPVRPEFEPTLPDLVGPRLRALPPLGRIAVAILLLVVAAGAAYVLWPEERLGGRKAIVEVVREPFAFNLIHTREMERVAPQGDEVLRLEARNGSEQTFTVSRIALPAHRGAVEGELPVLAGRLAAEMRAADPTFVVRGEGRARVVESAGYQLVFQFRRGGRTLYGKRIVVYDPDADHPAEVADLMLTAPRGAGIPYASKVGQTGAVRTPLGSFRFGTERP